MEERRNFKRVSELEGEDYEEELKSDDETDDSSESTITLPEKEVKKNQAGITRYPFDEREMIGNLHSGNYEVLVQYDSDEGVNLEDVRQNTNVCGLQWYSPLHKTCYSIQSKRKLFHKLKSLAGQVLGTFAGNGLAVNAYYNNQKKFEETKTKMLKWVGSQLVELGSACTNAASGFENAKSPPSRLELFVCFGDDTKTPIVQFGNELEKLVVAVEVKDIVAHIRCTEKFILTPLARLFAPWVQVLDLSPEAKMATMFLAERLNARLNLVGLSGAGRISKAIYADGVTLSSPSWKAYTVLTHPIDISSPLKFGIKKTYLHMPASFKEMMSSKFKFPSSVLAEVAKKIDTPELYSKMFFVVYKTVAEGCLLNAGCFDDESSTTESEQASILDKIDYAGLAITDPKRLLKLMNDMARILVSYYRQAAFHVHVSKIKRMGHSDLHCAAWEEVPQDTVQLSEFAANHPDSYFELSQKRTQDTTLLSSGKLT
jgi:hypothetical protein